MGEAGADVVGVDWRTPLAAAIPLVGDRAVQGNLDPTLVFAPTDVMTARAAEVIEAGRAARGHIFNLGHGVIPSTDPDQLKRLTEFVQAYPRLTRRWRRRPAAQQAAHEQPGRHAEHQHEHGERQQRAGHGGQAGEERGQPSQPLLEPGEEAGCRPPRPSSACLGVCSRKTVIVLIEVWSAR